MIAKGISNIGLVRKNNEDRYFISSNPQLYVVCDGMGGHNGGDVAASMAVNAFKDRIDSYNGINHHEWLNRTIDIANAAIKRCGNTNIELSEMGTTVTAAINYGEKLYISHVGDSRLYVINDNDIKKITADHTLAQKMFREGIISEEELSSSSYNHILTRALGIEDNVVIDNYIENIYRGDIVLLCSDGLTDMLDEKDIQSIVLKYRGNIDKGLNKLTEAALNKGGFDNITAILVLV